MHFLFLQGKEPWALLHLVYQAASPPPVQEGGSWAQRHPAHTRRCSWTSSEKWRSGEYKIRVVLYLTEQCLKLTHINHVSFFCLYVGHQSSTGMLPSANTAVNSKVSAWLQHSHNPDTCVQGSFMHNMYSIYYISVTYPLNRKEDSFFACFHGEQRIQKCWWIKVKGATVPSIVRLFMQ